MSDKNNKPVIIGVMSVLAIVGAIIEYSVIPILLFMIFIVLEEINAKLHILKGDIAGKNAINKRIESIDNESE